MSVNAKPLFSRRVLDQHLAELRRANLAPPAEKIHVLQTWWDKISNHYLDRYTETQVEQAFNSSIFSEVLGYVPLNAPHATHNIVPKRSSGGRDIPDFVLGTFNPGAGIERWRVVGEIKSIHVNLDLPQMSRFNPETPVEQGFRYALNGKPGVEWIIVTNFIEIRLYRNGYAGAYHKWDLENLCTPDRFFEFWALLRQPSLCPDTGTSSTLSLLEKSLSVGAALTEGFYRLYDLAREELFKSLRSQPVCKSLSDLAIHGKTHKLLNRILFAAFCEDHPAALLPPDTLKRLHHEAMRSTGVNKYWNTFQRFFWELDRGSPPGSVNGFHAFNGGLFAPDPILDNVELPDTLFTQKLRYSPRRGHVSRELEGIFGFYVYDFGEELDVDSLGAIFEQSLKDIMSEDAVRGHGAIEVSKREDTGVYYTPGAITEFLVSRALNETLVPIQNKLLAKVNSARPKKSQFKFGRKALSAEQIRDLLFLKEQIEALKTISLQDPACGSGAFLVESYRQLWDEYNSLNAAVGRISGAQPLFGLDKVILSNNLHGTDILQESVEITRLSLWLRTASKTDPLEKLDATIHCGDSLRDRRNASFDIIVSNPPWGATLAGWSDEEIRREFPASGAERDSYALFTIASQRLLRQNGILALILPNSWLTVASYGTFRRWLLSHFIVLEIVHVWKIFKDVNHDACLLLARKRMTLALPAKNESTMIRSLPRGLSEETKWQYLAEERWKSSFEARPSEWVSEPDARFETIYPPKLVSALNRAFKGSRPLGEVADVTVGIQVYHRRNLTRDEIENRVFHSKSRDGADWFPFLTGNEIQRYFEFPAGAEFLRYSERLCDKRALAHYAEPRILIQQIFWNRLSAALSFPEEPVLYQNSLFSVTQAQPPYTLGCLLAILNSRLMSSSYERFANRIFGDKFPKVSKLDLARLPIPPLNKSTAKALGKNGLELTKMWTGLKSLITEFQNITAVADPSGTLGRKLSKFWVLTRGDVTDALGSSGHIVQSSAVNQFLEDWKRTRTAVQKQWGEIMQREEAIEQILRSALRIPANLYYELISGTPEPSLEDALLPK